MDISQKLNDILSSPEKLSQVMQIAGELMGSAKPSDGAEPVAEQPTPVTAPPAPQALPAGGTGSPDILSMLGSLDPKIISMAMNVFGALGRDDDRTSLIRALKPHLKAERAERIDKAVQILRVSGAIRAALTALNGGNNDVQSV